MSTVAITSPPTLGAGRILSWTFPWLSHAILGAMPNNNAGLTGERPTLVTLLTGVGAAGMVLTTTGVPPVTAPSLACVYQGRYCMAVVADGTTGRMWTCHASNQGGVMPFTTIKGGIPGGLEDWNVLEMSAILAFDNPTGPITGDIGFGFCLGGRAQIRLAGVQQMGVEIGPRDVGSIGIIARQADLGAATIDQALPKQPTDMTLWNNYTIRLVGATKTAEGQLKVLVNGIPSFTAAWGTGSLLPEQSSGAVTTYGFMPFMINVKPLAATTRMYVPSGGISVRFAPTENDLA